MTARPQLALPLLALVLLTACTVDSSSSSSAKPGATPSPKVLLSQEGQGSTSTASFTTQAAWDVQYSYDCPGGAARPFKIFVQRAGDPVNVLADSPDATGESGERTARWPHGGSYSLKVDSTCTWTVEVLEG